MMDTFEKALQEPSGGFREWSGNSNIPTSATVSENLANMPSIVKRTIPSAGEVYTISPATGGGAWTPSIIAIGVKYKTKIIRRTGKPELG